MSALNPKLDELKGQVAKAIERVDATKAAYQQALDDTTAAKAAGPEAFTIALARQRELKSDLDNAFAAQARAIDAYQREQEAENKRWHEKPCTNCGKVRRYRDGMKVPDNICPACRRYRKAMGTRTPLPRNW